jgi:hypothetical protein
MDILLLSSNKTENIPLFYTFASKELLRKALKFEFCGNAQKYFFGTHA